MSEPTGISAHDLAIRRGQRTILSGIDLEIGPGELVAVIGPNGGGKTSLLLALAGLLSSVEGRLDVGGIDPRTKDRARAARSVSLMPQNTDFPFALPARDIVVMGASARLGLLGVPGKRDVERAQAAMQALEIDHLAASAITRLSGGERQRVLFATQVVQAAPVALFDEPTSAQDFRGISLIVRHLRELAERGVAVVAAVHDLNIAARHFDRLVLVHDGRITADDPAAELTGSAELQLAYQGAVRVLDTPDGPVLLPVI